MPYLVQTFASRMEADLAARVLKDKGVDARVSASDVGGVAPGLEMLSKIRIEVAESDLDRAESVVRDFGFGAPVELPRLSNRERLQSWAFGIGLLALLVWFVIYSAQNIRPTRPLETLPQAELPW